MIAAICLILICSWDGGLTIHVYYWTTANGHKITIYLDETTLRYSIKPINIGAGDQFAPEFLAISPNDRIPAIVDDQPEDGGAPLSIFESGAILQYLTFADMAAFSVDRAAPKAGTRLGRLSSCRAMV